MFNKNLFLIKNDDMYPYVSKGDVVIFEPMQMNKIRASSVYIVEYNNRQMIVRVQLLIKGGMNLIFDGDETKLKKFEQHERERVIFVGHVTGRVLKDGELMEGYSLYDCPFNQ